MVSGSLRTQDRLHAAGLADSATCVHCGLEPETLQHLWWECPAWQHLRCDPQLPTIEGLALLPPCTRNLGIFMKDGIFLSSAMENDADAKAMATATHAMMVQILLARNAHEENSDSESEQGDC